MSPWTLAATLLAASIAWSQPKWPAPEVVLQPVALPDAGVRKIRVAIDAGHGSNGNHGAQSAICEAEEVFTLRAAESLADALEATGRFEVLRLRRGAATPSYAKRVKAAAAFMAEALVSLHFDVRGLAVGWAPTPSQVCWRAPDLDEPAPRGFPPEAMHDSSGFSVLWSEDGAAPLANRRMALGRALARRLTEAKFGAYDGFDYPGLYEADSTPGAFVDAHAPGKRIWMLSRPELPVVIVETHHALDVVERARWERPETHAAFASAIAAGLLDVLAR